MTRTVLITGASSGIGLSTLRRFAAAGWDVTAAVRSPARATELTELLRSENLVANIVSLDLSDRAAADEVSADIIARGVPDVIVNNAGVGAFGPVELTDDASIDLLLETNFIAPLRLIRAFIPHLRERRSGVIVNITSGLGFASDVGQGIYAASKHALEAVSEALYYELRPFNIRVAVIEPGLTATGIQSKSTIPSEYGPSSPYWETLSNRIELLASSVWKDGWAEDPTAVADAIYSAATTSATPLFTPVGRDTKLSADFRGRAELDTYEQRMNGALHELAKRGTAIK